MGMFDVIIIGGGITGAGTQRDCAMRGLRTLLIERSDIATGATGRNHGLLHSGARFMFLEKKPLSAYLPKAVELYIFYILGISVIRSFAEP